MALHPVETEHMHLVACHRRFLSILIPSTKEYDVTEILNLSIGDLGAARFSSEAW